MSKYSKIVSILLDSLPHIKLFNGSTMVIKYGGAAQINPKLKEQFAIDIVMLYMLGIKPIIVHGGGKRITELLDLLQIQSEFVDGHRMTTKEAMKVVEMVLAGEINKELSAFLNYHGIKAVGISGKDGNLLQGYPKDNGKLGFVGEIAHVESQILHQLQNGGFVPIIAPIATSNEVHHPGFNINADTAASAIAKALKAKKVLFLTDTRGVLDSDGELIQSLDIADVERLKENGVISGGMIPKIDACIDCVQAGVQKAHIIDGRVEHALLLELFTSSGIGTEIVANKGKA